VVQHQAARIHEVADGAEVIGQIPHHPLGRTEAGQQFVGGIAVQVAGLQRAVGVEIGPDGLEFIDGVGDRAIDVLSDAAVEDVVGVLDPVQQGAAGVALFDQDQSVAVVVAENGRGSRRDLDLADRLPSLSYS
jgi:hypothetical protein